MLKTLSKGDASVVVEAMAVKPCQFGLLRAHSKSFTVYASTASHLEGGQKSE